MTDAVDLGKLAQPAAPQPEPTSDGFEHNNVPVKIHHTNGRCFVVDKIAAWGYLEAGVFATGNWKGYSGADIDVVIPYNRIEFFELDYNRLKKYIADYAASKEARDAAAAAKP